MVSHPSMISHRWEAGEKARISRAPWKWTFLNKKRCLFLAVKQVIKDEQCTYSQLPHPGYTGVSWWQENHGVLSLSPWQGACRDLMVCPHCQLQPPSRPDQRTALGVCGFVVYSFWDSLMNGYLREWINSLPLKICCLGLVWPVPNSMFSTNCFNK